MRLKYCMKRGIERGVKAILTRSDSVTHGQWGRGVGLDVIKQIHQPMYDHIH